MKAKKKNRVEFKAGDSVTYQPHRIRYPARIVQVGVDESPGLRPGEQTIYTLTCERKGVGDFLHNREQDYGVKAF